MNAYLISNPDTDPRRQLASIDEMMQTPQAQSLITVFGRSQVLKVLKAVSQQARERIEQSLNDQHRGALNLIALETMGTSPEAQTAQTAQTALTSATGLDIRLQVTHQLLSECAQRLEKSNMPHLKEVINLTGTVLHTNFGRAIYSKAAIDAAVLAMGSSVNLEYDLARGARGERDDHVESLLCELTGAQAATAVNNNAAAVLLCLSTLASRKEVLLSRGELVEIGGSFRIPDVMKRAGAVLREVGTTNRTHLRDFKEHITPKVAALMKVHTSNYSIQGFTSEVSVQDLSKEAHAHDLPLIVDLGSGTLMDLNVLGLAHEPTVAQVIQQGADVVTFSGDKLLGGPQCGIIVGNKSFIERMRKNQLRRALRLDKVMIAALEATLKLYLNPEALEQDLPTLRFFKRQASHIQAQALRLCPIVQEALQGHAQVMVEPCASQVGSGALPIQTMPSFALVIKPLLLSKTSKKNKSTSHSKSSQPQSADHMNEMGSEQKVFEKKQFLHHPLTQSEQGLEKLFRGLSTPVLGRVQKGQLVLDLRCLEERQEKLFCKALTQWAKSTLV